MKKGWKIRLSAPKWASVSTEITVSPSLLSSYLFWKRHPCLNHWVRPPPLQQNSSFLLDLTVQDNGKYIQIQRSIISIFLCFDGTALNQSDKAQLCIAFYCLQMRLSSSDRSFRLLWVGSFEPVHQLDWSILSRIDLIRSERFSKALNCCFGLVRLELSQEPLNMILVARVDQWGAK